MLTDASGYAAWDSGIQRVDGTIATGEKITVHASVNPGRAFPVKARVDQPAGTVTWSGGMPLGLFKGVRTFTLTPSDNGGTVFTMREEFSGPMLGLIWRLMPDLGPPFQQFVDGLRTQAERVHKDA